MISPTIKYDSQIASLNAVSRGLWLFCQTYDGRFAQGKRQEFAFDHSCEACFWKQKKNKL